MTATLPEMSPAWIVPPKKSSYEKKVTMRRGVKTADVEATKRTFFGFCLSVCARLEKVVAEVFHAAPALTGAA